MQIKVLKTWKLEAMDIFSSGNDTMCLSKRVFTVDHPTGSNIPEIHFSLLLALSSCCLWKFTTLFNVVVPQTRKPNSKSVSSHWMLNVQSMAKCNFIQCNYLHKVQFLALPPFLQCKPPLRGSYRRGQSQINGCAIRRESLSLSSRR